MSLRTYNRIWYTMASLTIVLVILADVTTRGMTHKIIVDWILYIFIAGWIALALISFWNTENGEPGFNSEE